LIKGNYMTDIITTILLWINLIVFLAYIPLVCYLDIRYREIHPGLWLPMVCICSPIFISMLLMGFYPWYSTLFSIVMIVIFKAAMHYKYIAGADFLFLSLISLFWVVTPVGWVHGLMQIQFYIYLIFTSLITAVCLLGINYYKGHRLDVITMMGDYRRGIPYMVPISAAFLMSVAMG